MKKLLLALLTVSLILPAASFATAPAEIEIIFDASGSMNDPTREGIPKIDAAKEALTEIAGHIEAGSKVGLRVFGTDPKDGDPDASCRDSKLVLPISGFKKENMVNQVVGLLAQGQTPIGYSLKMAAKDFTAGPDVKKTIILISDGEERCGVDPVAVMADLKRQGIDVVVHTIGFDVNPEARAQLQQLAEMTGGTFAIAASAGELKEKLQSIAEKAELVKLAPEKQVGQNILSAANGCRIITSSTVEFAKLIDGDEKEKTKAIYSGQEAVFAFKNDQPVLLESFAYPVFEQSNYHPHFIDLYGSLESPESGFRFLQRISIDNKVHFDNIYHQNKLENPAAIRYLKAVVGPRTGGSNSYQKEWAAYGRFLSEAELQAALAEEAKRDKNLLASENGGKLIAASRDDFKFLIDGTLQSHGKSATIYFPQEGIFGFKEGKTALIKKVTTPIFKSYKRNPKTIEIWASKTSPTGGYEKVGTFETMDLAFAENPYQEFVFETPVEAKYLKIKFIDSHGGSYISAHEIQAIGILL